MHALPRRGAAVATALMIVTVGAGVARADTTAQNLDKYRRLRARLVTEFTSVGPDQGQSQPAPERMDAEGRMKWGDGTIALGFYLGVLASEHHMLTKPAQFPGAGDAAQLERTRNELYYALLALERLDNTADAAFPAPCSTTTALNGFFLRDDVPASFTTKFPGITTIESDFIDPTLTNKEESQDQIYHVQHGLALVVALVPANVVVQNKPLRAWAIQQAHRIAQHFAKSDWIIRNPACGNRAVNRGENAIGFSYGETLAAKYVTAGALMPTTSGIFMNAWNTLRQPTNPTYNDADNLHMAMAIMAVGDGYGTDTPQVLATLTEKQDWPVYPLLHRVLHPASPGFCMTAPAVNGRARTQLDELPSNGEPACPGPVAAPHGFTTHNRYIRGKDQAYVGPPGCQGIRYHGLDYMLLHNLYALATPGTWNGSPSADPCAPVTGDGATAGGDAGTTPDGGGTGDPATGCGCDLSNRGSSWSWLFAIVLMWIVRRRR
ncbi:MAG: hypothetical protein M4D80_26810 [Myxococcota bacterium]|nr:hypothetical protein [Deltaproteobacteria bacterium]MDQ3338794.1 hypothetical protein [Myxococcota bacterium]